MIRPILLRWLVCAAVGIVIRSHGHTIATSPLQFLAETTWRNDRRVEARLSGFRWAPYAEVKRLTRITHDDSTIAGYAGRLFLDESANPSVSTRRAAAAASLLIQHPAPAVERLEQILRIAHDDSSLWNDLAAARHEVAQHRDEAAGLPAALAAADRALRISPDNAEARFNRALILSRLGLLHAARTAWQESLAIERDPDWRREIERRLHSLDAATPPDFRGALDKALASAAREDDAPLKELARSRIQELRMAGEALALNTWPEALLRRDVHSGELALDNARHIARVVCATNGDCLLVDVIETIDHARKNATRWRAIVEAHRAYRAARMTYHRQLPDSDVQLNHAATLFERIGSPMANVARYFCANAMFDRNLPEKSADLLSRVLSEVDVRRHPTLAAGAEKELGLYHAFRGMWSAALLHLGRAERIYKSAGEPTNAAFAAAIVGEACDRIGQFTAGWQHRRNALLVLSRSGSAARLAAVMAGAVQAEMMRGDYESALSLLRIATEDARASENPILLAEMLLRKAHVLLAVRRAAAASAVLDQAEGASDDIKDPLTRSRIQADIWVVESEIVRRTDPLVARDIATRAIAFYEARNFHMLLPRAYLERARAALAAGDHTLALDDLLRGLSDVEQQRSTVSGGSRATLFDTAPDLMAESVRILLAQGRTADAFAIVERARARTLTEALGLFTETEGARVRAIVSAVPAQTAILEYVLLPDGVVVFFMQRGRLSVMRLPAKPDELRERISALSASIDRRDPIDRVNGVLSQIHRVLIAPMTDQLRGFESLVIVPDRFLNAIPFPALFDEERARYLIEDYRITIAPSSIFALRRARARKLEPFLIINDPLVGESDPSLPGTRSEAAGIARLYHRATVITGPEATAERFLAAAPRSAVIHYAGHARSSESGGLLSLAPSANHDGKIDAASIGRLSLPATELVVLAACETLRGSGDRVEGMPSVARAFLAAGVPTVVGTLWEVDDRSTAALFLRFHEFLRQGRSPATALRAAQCTLLRDGNQHLRHPALWAAAEVLGSD